MICKICNKKFKAITNTHLKTHNITMADYSFKYGLSCLNTNQGFKRSHVPWNKGSKGLQKPHNKGSCLVDHTYFKKYSSNMFYILGLWFADGTIHKYKDNCKMLSLSLNIDDIVLVEQIKSEIKLNKQTYIYIDKRYKNKGQAKIDIYSEEMYDDLVSFGCIENKSLIIKFPEIPDEFKKDFVRGYMDGDGSIFIDKRNKFYLSFTSGSYDFLSGVIKVIEDKLNLVSKIYDKNNKGTCFFIRYNGNNAIKVCSWLYDNPTLFMKRKFDKYCLYKNN